MSATPTGPANALRELAEQHLTDPTSGWSIGTVGAIAEFVRTASEPVSLSALSAVTDRGGVRLVLPDETRAVAYETPAGPGLHWNHTVSLCLPNALARGSARTTVTELGPDAAALREQDRDGVLFDLGFGTPTTDVCVRTSDPLLVALLREAEGTAMDGHLVHQVAVASPHRVFMTAGGRIEVYAAIPAPGGRSPDGPHTHVLPHLLRLGRTHAATAPVPEGHLPVAALYPAHPTVDQTGTPRAAFDHAAFQAFQDLLARFGAPGTADRKAATWRSVRAGGNPPREQTPAARAAVIAALRQLEHLEGHSTDWADQDLHALLDPDGDPNG